MGDLVLPIVYVVNKIITIGMSVTLLNVMYYYVRIKVKFEMNIHHIINVKQTV